MKKRFSDFINKLKHLSRKQIIWSIIFVLLIIAYFVLGFWSDSIVRGLEDQNEGERWAASDDDRMAQVNVYFTEASAVTASDISKFEYNIEQKLESEAVVDAETTAETDQVDTSRDYADCYSASGTITIDNDSKSIEVDAYGVGGDFFMFHPLDFVSGTYFASDALMQDAIVIDEDVAWQLFGSNNIVGEYVTIEGIPHYVSGVFRRSEGKFEEAAGLDSAVAIVSYDSLSKYGSITSGATTSSSSSDDDSSGVSGGINCYQVVMPNPVDNYAANFLTSALSLEDSGSVVVDSSARFTTSNLFSVIASYGTRSMRTIAIVYPYWENVARGYEDILALLLIFRVICISIPIIIICILIINGYRHKTWTAAGVFRKVMDFKYDLESDMKYHKDKWKYF